jgi:hypothetical protein
VRAGVDVARLWLDGHPTLFHITARDDEVAQTVALEDNRAGEEVAAPLVRGPAGR